MATNNTTFWNLINSYKISIPIIQRDYAQGREEESEKREKFLNAIFMHLSNNEKLHLDFVYGRVKDNTFFPIDGQQRLTTLFLLHWYFALKEKEIVSYEEKSKLSKFVYDTRISSREFCQSLIKEDIELPLTTGDRAFINGIKNKSWYRDKWETDPTIKAMLLMIQDIHNKFYFIKSSFVFTKLVTENSISFELLDLGTKGFELTDELYIKMNARGKQLTAFENFKANFIQLIDKNFKNKKLEHPIKGKISYSGYFSYKIEKEWTDLFWSFRGDKKTTDDGFSNYIEFIAQMLYFKTYKDANAEDFKNSFTQYEDIFSNESNLLFLFNSLDKLHAILCVNGGAKKENVNNFFSSIENTVSFFWNTTKENTLFERIVLNTKKEDVRNKILLFAIVHYIIEQNLTEVNHGLKYYIRIVRNLLQATRQRNETKYNTNVRINNFAGYWLIFKQLATDNPYITIRDHHLRTKGTFLGELGLTNERIKADKILLQDDYREAIFNVEELPYFGGLIHQLRPQSNIDKIQLYSKIVREILHEDINDTLKIQALIASGFGGIEIKDCKMGTMWYFGRSGNWTTIITDEKESTSDCILKLLNTYEIVKGKTTQEKLQSIVDKWFVENENDRTWKYYFLKYSFFTSQNNYYAWKNDFEIRMLRSESSNPLIAYHINPYVLTVCKLINDKNICDADDCYQQYSVNSPLTLKNGVALKSKLAGWHINKNHLLTKVIVDKFALYEEDAYYVLKETNEKDRIQIAIDFINSII